MRTNDPQIWLDDFSVPAEQDHKYKRGQVAVLGGVVMTGAACLVADSAARIGAGLVTVIAPVLNWQQKLKMPDPLLVYRNFKPHIIARNDITLRDYAAEKKEKGQVVCVIGPGLGDDEYKTIRQITGSVLSMDVSVVLDADGLNAFAGYAEELKGYDKLFLTPHDGEFARLFPDHAVLLKTNRVGAAELIAETLGVTVVLKGHKTVIAQKGEKTVVNENAPPYLATAGAGDVLAGMIGGLVAQGMSPFEAACAAVWIHGEAAEKHGIGLVASDLPDLIPKVLQEVLGISKNLG